MLGSGLVVVNRVTPKEPVIEFEDQKKQLIDMGAHLVRCAKDKKPMDKAWQKKPWNGKGKYELVGIIPSSLGYCVIDVDQPKEPGDKPLDKRISSVRDAMGPALFNVETRSGGVHFYYQ